MLTGSAQQTLDVFKQILSDFQLTVGSQAKAKLVTSIKNTMSDRHIVQKNFNCLLEEYHAWILPESDHVHGRSSLLKNNTACLHLTTFFVGYICLLEWLMLLHPHYYSGKQLTFLKTLLTMLLVYWCASLNQELSDLCELLVKH